MLGEMLRADVLVAVKPFATYRALGLEAPPSLGHALTGPLGWLVLVACFVSWTTSGNLLVEHLAFSPLAWCFVPLVQAASVVVVAGRFAGTGRAQAIALYYRGHLPWLGLLVLVAGLCLIVPDPWPAFGWLLETGVLPVLVAVATIWCALLTYAMFRAGLGLSRQRSLAATAAHYLGCTLAFTSWFLLTGQLLPLWGIM